jgi:hypothetical protein
VFFDLAVFVSIEPYKIKEAVSKVNLRRPLFISVTMLY